MTPLVPDFNNRPLKPVYSSLNPGNPASTKQKNLIMTMCEKRGIRPPDTNRLTNKEASEIITAILES